MKLHEFFKEEPHRRFASSLNDKLLYKTHCVILKGEILDSPLYNTKCHENAIFVSAFSRDGHVLHEFMFNG
jgi:hypothetical protein